MMASFLKNLTLPAALLLLLSGCLGHVGQGGPGKSEASPGTPGSGTPGSETVFGLGNAASGPDPSADPLAAPEMPNIPVAPDVDIDEPEEKARKVEYRVEGKITAVCRDPVDKRVRKSIEGQLFCRWKGAGGPFTVCGQGRYLYIHDPKTHHFLNTKASEADARFGFDFRFHSVPKNASLPPSSRPTRPLLAAQFDSYKAAQKATKSDATQFLAPVFSQPDPPQKLPEFFGEPNDKADKNLTSDASDMIVYARSLDGYEPAELGVQIHCGFPDMCEPGGSVTARQFIRLGAIQFTGVGPPETLPECEAME